MFCASFIARPPLAHLLVVCLLLLSAVLLPAEAASTPHSEALFVVGGDFVMKTPDGDTLQQPVAYDSLADSWHSIGGGFPLGTQVFSVQPYRHSSSARALLVCGDFRQFTPERGAPADGSTLSTVAVYDLERAQWDSLAGGIDSLDQDSYTSTGRGLCTQSSDGSLWVGMRGYNLSSVYRYGASEGAWRRYAVAGGTVDQIDSLCGTGQPIDPHTPPFFTTLNSVVADADGGVMIAGQFTEVDGQLLRTPNVARFTVGRGWGEVDAVAPLEFDRNLTLLQPSYSCQNFTPVPISPVPAPCSSAPSTDLCCLLTFSPYTFVVCEQKAAVSLLQLAPLGERAGAPLLQLGPSYPRGTDPEVTFVLSWWASQSPSQVHSLSNPYADSSGSSPPTGVFVQRFLSGGADEVAGYLLVKNAGGEDTGQPVYLGLWEEQGAVMRELSLIPPPQGRWFWVADESRIHADRLYVSGIVDSSHQDHFQGRVLRWSVPVSEMLQGTSAKGSATQVHGIWEDTPYSAVYQRIASGGFVPCFTFL
mmetsp:Transcript_21848/g.54929  ORF Transcript_21848/g.54929 Transcript_21848/m.54929 type:complete len:532 (+) Transcript_21848:119-1714(+)